MNYVIYLISFQYRTIAHDALQKCKSSVLSLAKTHRAPLQNVDTCVMILETWRFYTE